MIGLVEHRPDQVVHRAVNHDEALDVGLLDVKHARHERAGVADQHAAGLDNQLQPETAQRPEQRGRVFRGRRRLFLVGDTETAAEVEVAQRHAAFAQRLDDSRDLVGRPR